METYAFSFKTLSKLTALFRSFLFYLTDLYNAAFFEYKRLSMEESHDKT